jgi:hypothetical protein
MNEGKAMDGLLDKVSTMRKIIDEADVRLELAKAAHPAAAGHFEDVQRILHGNSNLNDDQKE